MLAQCDVALSFFAVLLCIEFVSICVPCRVMCDYKIVTQCVVIFCMVQCRYCNPTSPVINYIKYVSGKAQIQVITF